MVTSSGGRQDRVLELKYQNLSWFICDLSHRPMLRVLTGSPPCRWVVKSFWYEKCSPSLPSVRKAIIWSVKQISAWGKKHNNIPLGYVLLKVNKVTVLTRGWVNGGCYMYWSILMFQHVQLFGRLNRNISCVSTGAFFGNCLLLEERNNTVPEQITETLRLQQVRAAIQIRELSIHWKSCAIY